MDSAIYIGGYSNLVTRLSLNDERITSDCGENPSYGCFSDDKKFFYAVNETTNGNVSAFKIMENGSLQFLNKVPSHGDDPCHILFHSSSPSSSFVYVSNYSSGTLTCIRLQEDGSLGNTVCVLSPGKNAHQAVILEGKYLYAPFLGSDKIFQYEIDPISGSLTPLAHQPFSSLKEGAGPRHLVFNSTHTACFVLNELDGTISTFSVNASSGEMSHVVTVDTTDVPWKRNEWSCAHILISPDDRFVYASNRGHNSLAIYQVEESTKLKLVAIEYQHMNRPRDFAMTKDGASIVVANQGNDVIATFSRDAESGLLKLVKVDTMTPNSKPCYVGLYNI
jgi:6-phosphogluconolactonase